MPSRVLTMPWNLVTYWITQDDSGLFMAYDSRGHHSRLFASLADAMRATAEFIEANEENHHEE